MKILNLIMMLTLAGYLFASCGQQQTAENEDAVTEDNQTDEADENLETVEFFVRGNCEMCQNRINEALTETEGVEKSSWSIETSMAKVSYDPEKVQELDLHLAVAGAGHRTEEVPAEEEAYNDLPPCCLDPEDPDYIDM